MDYGVYGRVLFCGQLEKRRDGAVRGGWASRLFLLTPDALHYFRKLPLSVITGVRAMPEDEVPAAAVEPGSEHYYLEISTESRAFLMRTPVGEASTCESWSIAIEQQRKALRAEQADQRACSPYLEALPSPTLLARNHELFSHFELSPPRIAMVSVVRVSERDAKPLEEVIKRKVAWGEALDLGVVPQGGACVILLQDGSTGRIGTQALMGSWDAGQACWIEVIDAASPTEVEVSVTCKVLSPTAKQATPRSESPLPDLPKWVEWADEGSSVGFLLMCLFVHLLYGVDGFHWSHKSAPPQILTPKHSNTSMLPKLQFSLTVHRCRIKMEGTEYMYPNESHQAAF
ncbi:hypothetical protein PybrP1_007945 [[Pythium] brassicae (nom. inval.)]|nr:hypothetical protein PybrP1_007945 [[Pythium] brassicae (nom. inval.)]